MVTAVQFFDVVLWVHIMAAFIAFGPTVLYGTFVMRAQQVGPQAFSAAAGVARDWDRGPGTAGAVVLFASGLWMALDRWDVSDFFVSWGMAAVVLILGLSHGLMIPTVNRVIDALDNGREDEIPPLMDRVSKVGGVLGLIVVLTIYVMTAKPFL